MRRLLFLGFLVTACGTSSPPPTTATAPPTAPPTLPPAPTASAASDAPDAAAVPTAPTSVAATTPVGDPSNRFTFSIYGRARAKQGNVLVSGTSIRRALGAAYLGARGNTAREMADVLELDKDVDKAASAASDETAAWEAARGTDKDGASLVIADRLWPDKSFAPKPDYAALATKAYGVSVEPLDLHGNAEGSRKTINAWVSEKTNKRIPDLLPAGSVNASTKMVITDAIWFKGRWSSPFLGPATKDEAFHVDAQKTVTVPTMHQTHSFAFAATNGVKVLAMPYVAPSMAMVFVLPDDPAALAKIEESLSSETLDAWTKALGPNNVAVSLPRFSFKAGGSVAPMLKDLGMKRAFGAEADFSGIAGGLFVDDVIHQTWIAVDEKGTEAAAATGVVMRALSLQTGKPVEFKADHPFLFFIRDTKTGRILFAGRVNDPKTS